MITLTNISKTFKTKTNEFQALKNVSLSLEDGLIHGIIGPSGAGKSTLIRTLNKLETYEKGIVNIFEYKDIKKLNQESTRMLRKKQGMIFQNFNLLTQKTVLENVLFPLSLDHKITEDDIEKAKEILNTVGLSLYYDSYPNQLSGGQKQRVGIARALVNNPKILLCDEPTSALDTQTIKSFLQLLKTLKETYNLTIIIVTHDMNVIKEICDTVTVMHEGEVLEHNTLDEIIFNPQTSITKQLLDTVGFNIEDLENRFKDYPNLSLLKFSTSSKHDSVISSISIKLKIKINILYANITPKDKGIMLVSIITNDITILQKVKHEFEQEGVEIKYV